MTEDAEGPPDTRGTGRSDGVVDHDLVAVADTEVADRFGERVRLRKHVGKIRVLVGNCVDVEEGGPRAVFLVVFGPRLAAGRRQLMAAVAYPDPGIVEMGGAPVRAPQGLVRGISHHSITKGDVGPPVDR